MESFDSLLTLENLEKDIEYHDRIEVTLWSYANIVGNMNINAMSVEQKNIYGEFLKKLVIKTLSFDWIPFPPEKTCIASVNLLREITQKQKLCYDTAQMKLFWKNLQTKRYFTFLKIVSNEKMGMQNASKAVDSFYEALNSLLEN